MAKEPVGNTEEGYVVYQDILVIDNLEQTANGVNIWAKPAGHPDFKSTRYSFYGKQVDQLGPMLPRTAWVIEFHDKPIPPPGRGFYHNVEKVVSEASNQAQAAPPQQTGAYDADGNVAPQFTRQSQPVNPSDQHRQNVQRIGMIYKEACENARAEMSMAGWSPDSAISYDDQLLVLIEKWYWLLEAHVFDVDTRMKAGEYNKPLDEVAQLEQEMESQEVLPF